MNAAVAVGLGVGVGDGAGAVAATSCVPPDEPEPQAAIRAAEQVKPTANFFFLLATTTLFWFGDRGLSGFD
jgi:hypothetical protein